MSPSPLSSSFDLRRRAFPSAHVSASLHTIVLKGDTDCSLVSSFSLSFRHGAFIGAIGIFTAFPAGFGVFLNVEPRARSFQFPLKLVFVSNYFFMLSLSAAFRGETFIVSFHHAFVSCDIQATAYKFARLVDIKIISLFNSKYEIIN